MVINEWASLIYRFIICFIFMCYNLPAKATHVAYIGPSQEASSYWKNFLTPLPAVAKQLNLTLTFHHPEHKNRFDIIPLVEALMEEETKPDFIISAFRNSNATPLLELIEKHKIPLITVSTGVPMIDQKKIGSPQQKYKYWVAQIISDDISSGVLLARKLIEHRRSVLPNKKVKMVAIGGNKVFEASRLRDIGLKKEISSNPNVDFLQLVQSNWDNKTAERMSQQLLNRHPEIDAIWAANIDVAFAAEKVMTNHHTSENELPDIATVDWTKEGFLAIKNEKIVFSLGSNHFIGVWALILYHDIANGFPILPSEPTTFITPYIAADINNIGIIEPYLDGDYWKNVNIKIFSKYFNKQLKNYNFDFELLLKDKKG